MFIDDEAALENGTGESAGDLDGKGIALFIGVVDAVAGLFFQHPHESGFIDEGAEGVAFAQGFPGWLDAWGGGFYGEGTALFEGGGVGGLGSVGGVCVVLGVSGGGGGGGVDGDGGVGVFGVRVYVGGCC